MKVPDGWYVSPRNIDRAFDAPLVYHYILDGRFLCFPSKRIQPESARHIVALVTKGEPTEEECCSACYERSG